MTTIFTPTDNELAAARAVVLAADPSESASSDGVAMVTRAGERRWVAWTPRVLATTAPVATSGEDAVVIVPRRLVEFGASLADELDDVEMLVDEDGVAVGNAESRISFDRLPDRSVPYVDADVDPAAQAVIDAHQLYRLFSMGAVLPDGVDLGTVAAPEFQLSVGRGTVLGWVDWQVAGAAATRFQFAAETSGEAFTLVSPATISHVLQMTERHEQLTLWLPETAEWVAIHASSWSAYVRCPVTDVGDGDLAQLELPFDGGIDCKGGLRHDRLGAAALANVRAYAIDPDVELRVLAAASRWNWDLDVQVTLATDPDERVVLALIDAVDVGVEACKQIIAGPHVEARRVLASRNLRTELLERLATGADPLAAERAASTLAERAARRQPAG